MLLGAAHRMRLKRETVGGETIGQQATHRDAGGLADVNKNGLSALVSPLYGAASDGGRLRNV